MPDKDVILAKVSTIQKCLKRISDVTNLEPESLNNSNYSGQSDPKSYYFVIPEFLYRGYGSFALPLKTIFPIKPSGMTL